MSRALDKDTASDVHRNDSQTVYQDVAEALRVGSKTGFQLLEIEILGKSHVLPAGCNILIDGNSVAIPKSKLVQAFLLARQIFFKALSSKDGIEEDICDSSAVILLMDPEHLTAANARKRYIQTYQNRPTPELRTQLTLEMLWVDSMLTSRLHRHTKSPTLWGHRRWVLEISQSFRMPHDVHKDLTAVVLVAAERHPRNYYAWLHMRWLVQHFPSANFHRDGVKVMEGFDFSFTLSTVLNWCLRHPGDTSGFSFLLFCLLDLPENLNVGSRTNGNSAVCKEILPLAMSFQWTHESVWIFLRTLVASGVTEDQREAFLTSLETIRRTQSGNSRAQAILQGARDWCIQYERKPHS
jgi:protein prenyltransferase alpha subunit repeat containing protein 1